MAIQISTRQKSFYPTPDLLAVLTVSGELARKVMSFFTEKDLIHIARVSKPLAHTFKALTKEAFTKTAFVYYRAQGKQFYQMGNAEQTAQLYQHACHLDPSSRDSMEDCYKLADAYREMGNLFKASTYCDQALEIGHKISPNDVEFRITYCNKKSFLLQGMGNLSEAENLQKSILNLVSFYRRFPLKEAFCYKNLAIIYEKKGDRKSAFLMCREALNILRNSSNKEALEAISCYNVLGSLYEKNRLLKKTLHYYQKALAIAKIHKQSGHIATCCINVAYVYKLSGELDTALTYGKKALEAKLLIDPNKKTVETGNIYNNVGLILQEKKKFFEALEYCAQAYACFTKIFDKFYKKEVFEEKQFYINPSPDCAHTLAFCCCALGSCYFGMRNFSKAAHYYSESVHYAKFFSVTSMHNQKRMLFYKEKLKAALAKLQQ